MTFTNQTQVQSQSLGLRNSSDRPCAVKCSLLFLSIAGRICCGQEGLRTMGILKWTLGLQKNRILRASPPSSALRVGETLTWKILGMYKQGR